MGSVDWGFACLALPGVCFHPKPQHNSRLCHASPGGTLDDNKTSSANGRITCCHSAELLC